VRFRRHLGRVRLQGGLELVHGRDLGVELLAGNGVLLDQDLVALEIEARVLQRRLVLRVLALLLLEGDLERAGIDLGQQVALAHELAFFIADGDELAVDAAAHGDGVDGGDGAEPVEVDGHLAGARGHRHHRDHASGGPVAGGGLAAAAAQDEDQRDDGDRADGQDEAAPPASVRSRCLVFGKPARPDRGRDDRSLDGHWCSRSGVRPPPGILVGVPRPEGAGATVYVVFTGGRRPRPVHLRAGNGAPP
jgi:hypothetical protein